MYALKYCVFWYIDVVYVCDELDEYKQVNAQAHDIKRLSQLRQWSCSGPAKSHCACVKQVTG